MLIIITSCTKRILSDFKVTFWIYYFLGFMVVTKKLPLSLPSLSPPHNSPHSNPPYHLTPLEEYNHLIFIYLAHMLMIINWLFIFENSRMKTIKLNVLYHRYSISGLLVRDVFEQCCNSECLHIIGCKHIIEKLIEFCIVNNSICHGENPF